MLVCNEPDRGSRFALVRKYADFQKVILSVNGLKIYEYWKANEHKKAGVS